MPITYVNTVIYKIVCKNTENTDCYVGHTTNIKSRKAEHKYASITEDGVSYNSKLYKAIRENGGWDNWEIIEIEIGRHVLSNHIENRKRIRRNHLVFELSSFGYGIVVDFLSVKLNSSW